MDSGNRSRLKGLSLDDLRRSATTSSPPAQFLQKRRTSELSDKLFSLNPQVNRSPSPLSLPSSSLLKTTLAPPSSDFSSSFSSKHASTDHGSLPLRSERSSKTRSSYKFQLPSMVREQEAARNPLAPSQGNTQPPVRNMDSQTSKAPASPTVVKTSLDQQNVASPQPVFGRPTQLGASPQPFARHQPFPSTNNPTAQKPSGARGSDGNNHLFISNKSGNRRPDYHKPQPISNPLQSLHKPPPGGNPLSQMGAPAPKPSVKQSQNDGNFRPRPTRVIDSSDDDDDVFEIPKPANFPTWQPKPVVHPTFSSLQSTNPYFQPNPSTTTFMSKNTLATNTVADGGIWEDRYNSSDPSIYLDSGKANEELKALFEGSVEDEDDNPKTKKKRGLEAKVADLADQMKSLDVKPGEQEEEQEEEDDDDEDDGTVEGLKVKLLPHQIKGVEWMRTKERGKDKKGKGMTKGGILADDMGLGKTIQSIALMLINKPLVGSDDKSGSEPEIKFDKGTLIVAPLALIKQWEGEIKDRVEPSHAFKVCVHHGPQRAKSYKELRKYDIVITTYQTLSSEHGACSSTIRAGCYGVNWYRIILDEAHSIKNRNAKVTKAACDLISQYRWCLSGTPMQNNLDELQSLIHFLQIGPLDKFEYWRSRITQPINSGRGGLAIKRLQTALKGLMLRRTKDVLKQDGALKNGSAEGESKNGKQKANNPGFKIVKRTVEKVEAQFTREERAFYSRLESRIDDKLEKMMASNNKMSYANALVLLLRLRQACNHAKLLGFDLAGERDALGDGTQTPRKKVADDVDDLTTMLGGLNVEMKQCDICQADLNPKEVDDGALRCQDCEDDLAGQTSVSKPKQSKKKQIQAIVKNDRKIKRRVIVDSDDEDEDGKDNSVKLKSKTVDLTNTSDDEDDDNDDDQNETDEDEDDDESDYSDEDVSPSDLIASTKIRHLLSILRNDSHTHKYIVFSFFTSMLNLIEPFLRQHHIKYSRYDGSMRNDAREASLQSLRSDPTTRVLLCSLRAGSLGLNLTAASRVVVLEPFWNPFVEEQAIDRVHRLNQTQDVVVYKLTIKDTVEARILELQEKKRELARLTVEGGAGAGGKGVAKLSLAEMMKLFEHSTERDAIVDMFGMKENGRLLKNGSQGEDLLDMQEFDERGYAPKTQRQWVQRGEGKDLGGDRDRKGRKEHEVYGRRW